jgi:hypothetical protein
MSTVRPLVQLLAFLVAVLTAFASAQPARTVERPEFDVRFGYPSAWIEEPASANGDAITLSFTAPGEAGLVVVVLARLSADDRASLAGVGPEGVWDAWEGFSAGMQGVSVEREAVRTVAGISAGVIEFVGQGITGSLISVIGDATDVTIVSIEVDGAAPWCGTVSRPFSRASSSSRPRGAAWATPATRWPVRRATRWLRRPRTR